MTWEIIGLPANGARALPGNRDEAHRAGIAAMTFIEFSTIPSSDPNERKKRCQQEKTKLKQSFVLI
jgi:hypothetical protein